MYDTFVRLAAMWPSDSYNALAPWYPPSRPGPADAAPCRGGAFSFCSSKPHAGPAPRMPEAKGQVLSEAEYHRYTRLHGLTQEAETHIRALKHAERNIHADIHPHSVPAGIGEWAYWWEGDEGTCMAAGGDVLNAHREREADVFTRLHRTKCRENVSERLSLLSRELPGLSQCADLSDHLFANGRRWRIFDRGCSFCCSGKNCIPDQFSLARSRVLCIDTKTNPWQSSVKLPSKQRNAKTTGFRRQTLLRRRCFPPSWCVRP